MKTERNVRPIADTKGWHYERKPMLVPGEDITTPNGEVWFHPYGGQTPVRVR